MVTIPQLDFKMDFISDLNTRFILHSNTEDAVQMKAYLKHKFNFFGIKAGPRRQLMRNTMKDHSSELLEEHLNIVYALYKRPEREFHYVAMELFERYFKKKYKAADIEHIEFLIVTNSWWDTVDYIAKWILGRYLQVHPEQIKKIIPEFSDSTNMWLNRSAILFQLGYKQNTDAKLLLDLCQEHRNSSDFFIQKAIGWALREYAKTAPKVVLDFVKHCDLAPLSKREAIRHLI